MMKQRTHNLINDQLKSLPWENMFIAYKKFETETLTISIKREEFKRMVKKSIFSYCDCYVNNRYQEEPQQYYNDDCISKYVEYNVALLRVISFISIQFLQTEGKREITIKFNPPGYVINWIAYKKNYDKIKHSHYQDRSKYLTRAHLKK